MDLMVWKYRFGKESRIKQINYIREWEKQRNSVIQDFTVFYRVPLVAASELKYNICNANLDKNKKKLFLYFDTSHANQTNIFFIHY